MDAKRKYQCAGCRKMIVLEKGQRKRKYHDYACAMRVLFRAYEIAEREVRRRANRAAESQVVRLAAVQKKIA